MPRPTNQERFWENVYKTDYCWFWIGNMMKNGYGRIGVNYERVLAHRYSWFLAYGVWPSLHVLHRCDIKQCVRPDHLFEGTNQDNHIDAANKGVCGLANGALKPFCKYGHPLSGDNLYIFPGRGNRVHRGCRTCFKQYRINYKVRANRAKEVSNSQIGG